MAKQIFFSLKITVNQAIDRKSIYIASFLNLSSEVVLGACRYMKEA